MPIASRCGQVDNARQSRSRLRPILVGRGVLSSPRFAMHVVSQPPRRSLALLPLPACPRLSEGLAWLGEAVPAILGRRLRIEGQALRGTGGWGEGWVWWSSHGASHTTLRREGAWVGWSLVGGHSGETAIAESPRRAHVPFPPQRGTRCSMFHWQKARRSANVAWGQRWHGLHGGRGFSTRCGGAS